jgi:hypothetical protein
MTYTEHFGVFGVLSAINGSKNGSKFGRGEPLLLGDYEVDRSPKIFSYKDVLPCWMFENWLISYWYHQRL